MKTALKNASANCLRKFKGLQLTFQVVTGHLSHARDVRHSGNVGSPTDREVHGDGAAIVVRARESLVHGEAAIRSLKMAEMPGMRDMDR